MTKDRRQAIDNLGKIGDARLDLVPEVDGLNPGLEPLEYNVIIAPVVMPEKVGSVFISDVTRENMELAMQVGRVVAVSPLAFNYDKWPSQHLIPKRGDIVWFARYAGGEFEGRDGRNYRIIKDKDIGARIKAEPKATYEKPELKKLDVIEG
jgi:co-chaperonin GroES (HSP10)